MGLDFLVATEINTLFVWVDRDVAQVADAFSWRIYTSDDNQNWDLRQTVSPAIYSPTFNRFEIRFTNVNARYVKVVTAPLSPTVPFASSFPTILVTELQAEIRRPASEVAGKQTSTFQNGTVDFRALLLESINLTYEFTYVFTKRDPGGSAVHGFQRAVVFPAVQQGLFRKGKGFFRKRGGADRQSRGDWLIPRR